MRPETMCIQAGYEPKNGSPRALPIYQSTTFTFDSTEHVGALFDLTAGERSTPVWAIRPRTA